MKIKRVYIENFGGLSKFTLNFNDNLTCINQHNGYGKTTLAEFIRAIFYGFCGTGDLTKNKERKKFMPWNGGKFGGYIDFECDGSNYRLERFFGKTARNDEARLYNLDNNKIAPNFNPDTFGYQIFGIDSDSFIRSAYIRANPDNDKFDTDGIKAKLANLVDDTDDVGNFEKAKKAIKDAKLSLVSNARANSVYKQANEELNRIDTELLKARYLAEQRPIIESNIKQIEDQLESDKQSLQDIKLQIHSVNNKTAKQTVEKQLSDIKTELNECNAIIKEFKQKYINGFPSNDEVEQLLNNIRKIEALKSQFSTNDRDEILTIGEKSSSTSIENIPTDDELNSYREKIEAIIINRTQLKNMSLGEIKQDRLRKLEIKFSDGVPTDLEIDESIQLNTEINSIIASKDQISLVDLEKQLEVYKFCFSDSVPTQKDIESAKEKLKQAEQLRETNNQIACEIGNIPKYDTVDNKKTNSKKTIFAIAGIILVVIGVILGLILSPIGFAGGLVGLSLTVIGLMPNKHRNNIDAQTIPKGDAEKLRDRMLNNSEKMRVLESEVETYLSRFAVKGDKLSDKLNTLSQTLNEFNIANEKYQRTSIDLQKLNLDIEDKKEKIRNLVGRYISLDQGFNEQITDLKVEIKEYDELKAEMDRYKQKEKELNLEISSDIEAVISGLSVFYNDVDIGNMSEFLDRLTKEVSTYKSNYEAIKKRDAENRVRENDIKQEEISIKDVLDKYKLQYTNFDYVAYKNMLDEHSEYSTAKERFDRLTEQYNSITKDNAEVLSYSITVNTDLSIDELREKENRLVDMISDKNVRLSKLHIDIKNIGDAEDLIPELEESLDYYISLRDECQSKANMLDKLSSLLVEAKDRLSKNYLYDVEENFKEIASEIMPEIEEKSSINSDLNILIQELGSFKERDTLSSGESDAVNLCMRIALTKTMFKGNAPIIILDDPFIHLDDNKIKKSTNIIKKLSEKYQILYLTCSEAREIK